MSSTAPALNGAEADLDAYAAQAAHQLGEAVALLRGYLSLLESRADQDAELGNVVRGMSAGAERAQRFVDDLLDLAASGRNPVGAADALTMGPVPLGEALGAARIRLAGELRDTGAELRSKPLPVVRGDRELIVRLLCHLLRAGLAAGATVIEIDGGYEAGCVRVDVRDDGAPANGNPVGAADAFAPFARARGRGPLVGAGVGLTVSRRIVALHGGTIALDGDADGGTVATFTLPADE